MPGWIFALVMAATPVTTLSDDSPASSYNNVIELIEYSGNSARVIAQYDLANGMARIHCVVQKELIARTSGKQTRLVCGLVV